MEKVSGNSDKASTERQSKGEIGVGGGKDRSLAREVIVKAGVCTKVAAELRRCGLLVTVTYSVSNVEASMTLRKHLPQQIASPITVTQM